jgi:hypothetical protein
MTTVEQKTCPTCQVVFDRKPKDDWMKWRKRKFCSTTCAAPSRRRWGRRVNQPQGGEELR